PYGLPAVDELKQEGVDIYEYAAADCRNDDRFANVAFINLMPEKQPAERDMLRMLAGGARSIRSSLDGVAVSFIRMSTHSSRNTDHSHIEKFYGTLTSETVSKFSAVIINGAPLERVEFEDVDYFHELSAICDGARMAGVPVLYLCWGAFFGIYRSTGIDKRLRNVKLSGVYRHKVIAGTHRLAEDLPSEIFIPHSRYCEYESDPAAYNGIEALISSEYGPGHAVLAETSGLDCYVSGHPEYSLMTLDSEYRRDMQRGLNPAIPENYYPDDDPSSRPVNRWSEFSFLLMRNWIRHYVIPSFERNKIKNGE
ncbi:MAG: homoserine O-succinyltransferase, partial [Muribaculaceae bacterium]|nr:homoserine O-succinyltransferase [Muribaculaceae bacterium]